MDFKKIFQFTILIFVLSILDIITTIYAIEKYPYLREGNGFMAYILNSGYGIFIIVKMFFVCVIVGIYKRLQKQNKLISNIGQTCVIILMLFVVGNNLVQISMAVDNFEYMPTCLEPSYDTGYIFQATSNNATLGDMTAWNLSAGYFYNGLTRINHGTNILCVKSDPTSSTLIGTQSMSRLFITDESGNVAWTDAQYTDYSAGFFTGGSDTRTLYKIGTLSASTYFRKLAIDNDGNIYTNDGSQIVKYTKSLDYTQSNFHTLTSGTDYQPANLNPAGVNVLDMEIDSNNNLYVLMGSIGSTGSSGQNNCFAYISYGVYSSSGARITGYVGTGLGSDYHGGYSGSCTFIGGGLILDSVSLNNSYLTNYSYAFSGLNGANQLSHNDSTSITSIATLTGITNVGGLGYNNYVLYVTSPTQNLIRGYSTTFRGYNPSSRATIPSELNYTIATVDSVYDSYYNNSAIETSYDVEYTIEKSPTSVDLYNRVSQKLKLIDSAGYVTQSYDIPKACSASYGLYWIGLDLRSGTSYECKSVGFVSWYTPGGWIRGGTWEIRLVESPSQSILDYDTFLVNSNESGSIGSPQPVVDLGSGENADAIGIIDQWAIWFLGMPLSDVSKLLFALIIITAIAMVFLFVTKNGEIAMLAAFAPYIFFTYILYIPKWIFIVVVILTIVVAKVFR